MKNDDEFLSDREVEQAAETDSALESLSGKPKQDEGELGRMVLDEAPKKLERPATVGREEMELLKKQLAFEQHRNDSLQGRIDSQLRPMNDLVQSLRQEVAELRGREPVEPAYRRALKPEELEAIGEPTAELNAKVAQTVVADALGAYQSQMEARLAQMEGQLLQRSSATLWDSVDKLAPGAKAANECPDPRWVQFLSGVDPASGRSRQALGEAAASSGDVRRLAALYQEFAEEVGEPAERRERELGSRVRPESTQPVRPGVRKPVMIRNSEIKKFYNDLARGHYEGNEERASKLEAAIELAQAEGRVILD